LRRGIKFFNQFDRARGAASRSEKHENRPSAAALAKKNPGFVSYSVAVKIAADVEWNASAFPFACAIACVRKTPTRRD
jgi:hypothetical protein